MRPEKDSGTRRMNYRYTQTQTQTQTCVDKDRQKHTEGKEDQVTINYESLLFFLTYGIAH